MYFKGSNVEISQISGISIPEGYFNPELCAGVSSIQRVKEISRYF